MHEASIAKSLLQIASHKSREAGLTEVNSIKVLIGKFHHIINEVLIMHFDLLKQDYTGFEFATLDIEQRDLLISCAQCRQTAIIREANFFCSSCGNAETTLIQGDELYIVSLEGTENHQDESSIVAIKEKS